MDEKLSPGRVIWFMSGLFLGVAFGIAAVLFRTRSIAPAPILITPPPPPPAATETATPAPVHVFVNGGVVQPDVYELPLGSLIDDAIDAAGGFTSEADERRINLAQPVVDGMQIYVPLDGEEAVQPAVITAPAAPASGGGTVAGPVNINTAGFIELEALPGIGPSLAQRILDYREEHGSFASIEAIQDVSGIGPAKFEQVRELITVGP